MKYWNVWIVCCVVILISACNLQPEQNPSTTTPAPHQNDTTDVLASNRPFEPEIELVKQIATPTVVPVSVIREAQADDLVFINVYQRVNPSVVNIEVTDQFSGSARIDASGSGFILDTQGHIVTNAHVVRDASEVFVTFSDGFVTRAAVVGLDDYSDLAVIRVTVDNDRLLPVELGDSNELLVGQRVIAIGNPFGLESSMTVGIISALGRALPSEELIRGTRGNSYNNPSIIQIDAAVNPGNSGGPILNMDGRVVGVATAIRTDTGTFQGVAFAVPVNTVHRIVPQLIANGEATYPWLGIRTSEFRVGQFAEEFNLPVEAGVVVGAVIEDSPAEQAGLLGGDQNQTFRGTTITTGGDIIVAVDGIFVRDLDELLGHLVENHNPGDEIMLTIVRDNQTLEISLVVGIRPGD